MRTRRGASKTVRYRYQTTKLRRRRRRATKKRGGANASGFNKAVCAPSPEKNHPEFTCYSETALRKIRDLWNARHPDAKIDSNVPYDIWLALKRNMQYTCHNETCWLKQQFAQGLDKKLLADTFAPFSPKSWNKNPNEWLSSLEIENVMKQYEKAYPCFEFLGPSPIDFDSHYVNGECVWEELCEFELASYAKRGINKIGVIFNTDPHTKGGSHWISLFINLKQNYVFFFDSNGRAIPPEVRKFVDRVIGQAKKLPVPQTLTFAQNAPVTHQYGNTECGMYSLYLIISLLTEPRTCRHQRYQDFMDKNKRIEDKDMEQLRHKLFNFNID